MCFSKIYQTDDLEDVDAVVLVKMSEYVDPLNRDCDDDYRINALVEKAIESKLLDKVKELMVEIPPVEIYKNHVFDYEENTVYITDLCTTTKNKFGPVCSDTHLFIGYNHFNGLLLKAKLEDFSYIVAYSLTPVTNEEILKESGKAMVLKIKLNLDKSERTVYKFVEESSPPTPVRFYYNSPDGEAYLDDFKKLHNLALEKGVSYDISFVENKKLWNGQIYTTEEPNGTLTKDYTLSMVLEIMIDQLETM